MARLFTNARVSLTSPSFSLTLFVKGPHGPFLLIVISEIGYIIKLGLRNMRITILPNKNQIGERVGGMIVKLLNDQPKAILGLATGSSPLPIYAALVKSYQEGKVSFKEVTTFNLDEYLACPIPEQTYRSFMNANLFSQVDIDPKKTHFPNPDDPEEYDEEVAKAGGVDLQLLGIGRDGHIGFNEPGTSFHSETHIVALDPSTLQANARFFDNKVEMVPTQAVTMGLGTIMKARHIVLVADDPSKKEAISQLLKGEEDLSCPASVLVRHQNVDIVISEDVLKSL